MTTHKRSTPSVLLVLFTFFVISLITNIIGPIFPQLVESFDISLALAGALPFSFFLAYGLMSIPAGYLVDLRGEKFAMIFAFALSSAGSLSFALFPTFVMAMLSLFLIGVGMAILQVAINPLLRVSGGESRFAFNSVIGQLLFGLGATVGPMVYSLIVSFNQSSEFLNIQNDMSWLGMYWFFALLSLVSIAVIFLTRIPKVEKNQDEKQLSLADYPTLIKDKKILFFAAGIAAYVGTEQGVANFISLFAQHEYGLDPLQQGATIVSHFWAALTLGCLLGLLLVKLIDSRKVLVLFSALAMLSLTFALFGGVEGVTIGFPLVGFFLSVMWSVIFSLALNSFTSHHGSYAGILCTAIVGGGITTPIIGFIIDISGSHHLSMIVVYLTLSYVMLVGIKAKPLIQNETLSLSLLPKKLKRS